MSNLRNQVKGLKIGSKKRPDYDPEDNEFIQQIDESGDSESDDSVENDTGREHYESVGRSKLRKPEKSQLDQRKYGCQVVSRSKIFNNDDNADMLAPDEDEDEDPFAAQNGEATGSEKDDLSEEDVELDEEDLDGEIDSDEELDSDEAFEEGEEDRFRGKGFVFRGSGKDLKILPTESDEESEDLEQLEDGGEAESDIDMEDLDDVSEGESDDDEPLENSERDDEEQEDDESESKDDSNARPLPSTMQTASNRDREALRALISNDTAALASSLSASLSADAKKGAAVKKQYQTFDRLLDARIKLQKGLTAAQDSNLNLDDTSIRNDEAQIAVQKAEEAALKLFATIESLRYSILEATTSSTTSTDTTSKKRKRPSPPTTSTSTSTLWSRISNLESQSLPNRTQTLDKWSTKTRSAAPTFSNSATSKLTNQDQTQSKLSSILTTYLQTETPKIIASSLQSDPDPPNKYIYNDTTFYQSLLRDLINTRAATSNTNPLSNPTNLLPLLPTKLHPSGNTSRSGTRKIDTKASKGRKVRYTVHEKLENFMAGEGRGNVVGQWNDAAVREFFGSLLGQKGMLGEDVDDGLENGVGEDREVEALRLFRT